MFCRSNISSIIFVNVISPIDVGGLIGHKSLTTFVTGVKEVNLPPLFLRKISFLSCLISAFKVKLLPEVLNLVSVSFMAVLILGLFFKTPAGLSLFFPYKASFQSFSKI